MCIRDRNSALEAELQTAKDASKEKIADRLKYGKTEQEPVSYTHLDVYKRQGIAAAARAFSSFLAQ